MKREPRWVKVFLKQLERTGNVRLAAERAGVDFTTAYQRRRRHAEFAEAWEGALAAVKERPLSPLSDAESPAAGSARVGHGPLPGAPAKGRGATPHPNSLPQGEREMVVRPDGKVIKGSEARWGKRAEERFLTELTVSANVKRAAAAAGFSTTAVYRRRLMDRHFTAAWDAAVETGKARVQAYLVEAATQTFDPDDLPIGDEREIPKVSIAEAINIAKLKAAEGRPGQDGWDEEPSEDQMREVRERILHKLQGLKARNDREMIEAGWSEHEIPAPPYVRDAERDSVWLPPGYRLVIDGES